MKYDASLPPDALKDLDVCLKVLKEINTERMGQFGVHSRHGWIPDGLLLGLSQYVVNHIRPGSFLAAVLENDLRRAVHSADPASADSLLAIVNFLESTIPSNCWGDADVVKVWTSAKTKR